MVSYQATSFLQFCITHLDPILPSVSTASDPTTLDAKHWGQNTGHKGQLVEIVTHTLLQHPSCRWTYKHKYDDREICTKMLALCLDIICVWIRCGRKVLPCIAIKLSSKYSKSTE